MVIFLCASSFPILSSLLVELSIFISNQIGVPINRIYIFFGDIDASNWAWNGKTFG